MKISAADTLDMSVDERILLVQEIWESIAEVPERVEVTPETLELNNSRLAAHRKDPHAASPWSEVRARILRGE